MNKSPTVSLRQRANNQAERQALELILSENITKSQFTDNQTSIKV